MTSIEELELKIDIWKNEYVSKVLEVEKLNEKIRKQNSEIEQLRFSLYGVRRLTNESNV